jgi:hypothetical protein
MSHLTERERQQIAVLRFSVDGLAFLMSRAGRRLDEAVHEDEAGHRVAAVGKVCDAAALLVRVARQAQELAAEAEAAEALVLGGGSD